MQASDLIALGALFVSMLSVISAYISRGAAEMANQINIHSHRKGIHDAFCDLRFHMTEKATSAQLQEVKKFYHLSRHAKFYFEKDLAEDLERYYGLCFRVADLAAVEKTAEEKEEVSSCLNKGRELSSKIEVALTKSLTLA